MSNEQPSDDENKGQPGYMKRAGLARKLTDSIPIPPELLQKVRELAKATGKSEQDVMNELVMKGMASTSEELTLRLARQRIVDTLDDEEKIRVLHNIQNFLREVGGVFGTWSATPQPILRTPSATTPQKSAMDQGLERAVQDGMEGLPNVSVQPPQPQQTSSQSSGGLTSMLGKYAIDKFSGIADRALDKLLSNPDVGKAISKLIEEKGLGFLDDLRKKLGGEGLL